MVDLNALPQQVGSWKLKPESHVYISESHFGTAAIVTESVVSFGYYKPCGANIKKVPVDSVEEVLSALTEFEKHWKH